MKVVSCEGGIVLVEECERSRRRGRARKSFPGSISQAKMPFNQSEVRNAFSCKPLESEHIRFTKLGRLQKVEETDLWAVIGYHVFHRFNLFLLSWCWRWTPMRILPRFSRFRDLWNLHLRALWNVVLIVNQAHNYSSIFTGTSLVFCWREPTFISFLSHERTKFGHCGCDLTFLRLITISAILAESLRPETSKGISFKILLALVRNRLLNCIYSRNIKFHREIRHWTVLVEMPTEPWNRRW